MPAGSHQVRTKRISAWSIAVAGSLSLATFIHVIETVSRRFVTYDSVVLWYAAPEWAHLRLHEPGFYGQAYGSTLAAVPVAFLHGLGMGYALALPIVLGASILTVWFALGLAAYKRGHSTTALFAFAAPALLSSYYVVYVTVAPAERAFALIGVGAFLLIIRVRRAWVTAVGVALVGIGTAVDSSAVVFVVPLALWWGLDGRGRAHVRGAVAGGGVAVVYAAYRVWFYAVHPDHNAHGGLPLSPSLDTLGQSLSHPYGVFRMFSPELFREWWGPVGGGALVLVGLLVLRRARLTIPALAVALFVLYALSTPRALDLNGLFLPPARILLFVPFSLWFLGFLAAQTQPRLPGWVRLTVVLLVVVAAALSFTERVTGIGTHSPEVIARASQHTGGFYAFYPVAPLAKACDRLARTVSRGHLDMVVTLDRTQAFACSVASTPIRTFNFPYEARAWTLEDAATRTVSRFVVIPAVPYLCDAAERRRIHCMVKDRGNVITVPSQPVLNVLALLGLRSRPFGPGCAMDGNRCDSGTDSRHEFPRTVNNLVLSRSASTGTAAVLASLERGDPRAVELGVDARRVVPRLARLLRTRKLVLEATDVQPTGTNTVQARIIIRGAKHATVSVQLLRVHERWLLAARSLCTLAATQHVPCDDPYRFFPI